MRFPDASAGGPAKAVAGGSDWTLGDPNPTGFSGDVDGAGSCAPGLVAAARTGAGAGVSVSAPNSASGSSPGSLKGNELAMTPVTAAVVQEALPFVLKFQ